MGGVCVAHALHYWHELFTRVEEGKGPAVPKIKTPQFTQRQQEISNLSFQAKKNRRDSTSGATRVYLGCTPTN